MHKLSPKQIVAIRRFPFKISRVAKIPAALTSPWPVNMLRAARKGPAARPGFFDQAAPETE
jgi:hypothetical protein